MDLDHLPSHGNHPALACGYQNKVDFFENDFSEQIPQATYIFAIPAEDKGNYFTSFRIDTWLPKDNPLVLLPPPKRHYTTLWRSMTRKVVQRRQENLQKNV
jgi:hypothetical protein